MPQTKINKAVILVELEDLSVHQAVIDTNTMRSFLEAVAMKDGYLKVVEEPIEGLTLQNG